MFMMKTVTAIILCCTFCFFGSSSNIIPKSDTERCPLVFAASATTVMVMAYNEHIIKRLRNSAHWNSCCCPRLGPSTWSMQALSYRDYTSDLELQTLALTTVVFVYPPWIVTGADPNHCHHWRAWFWLWKADENTNNSLWFFIFAGCMADVFSLVLVISRNSPFHRLEQSF